MKDNEEEAFKQMRNISERLDHLEQNVENMKELMKQMFPDAYEKYLDAKEKGNEEHNAGDKKQTS